MQDFGVVPEKRTAKQKRLHNILLGLVDHYIRTGKPVGSHVLQEAGFEELSSATIRNYFAQLETEGFLSQQHASGGRIPTHQAYQVYAAGHVDYRAPLDGELEQSLKKLCHTDTREVGLFLQHAAEWLSQASSCAVFLAAPRFDQDFILNIKIVDLDTTRCLVVIVTDFGIVQTEIVHIDKRLSAFAVKRIESYFHWRLTGHDKPENMTSEEERLAFRIYNEIMVRYIVGYSHFIHEDIYRTGLSQLLSYPELRDATLLSQSLALFENSHSMQLLLKECQKTHKLSYWIGQELTRYSSAHPECSVIAIPYAINQTAVGAVGLLGPMRLPYKQLFSLLAHFSEGISAALTRMIYKHKIEFRRPAENVYHIPGPQKKQFLMLEDKRDD